MSKKRLLILAGLVSACIGLVVIGLAFRPIQESSWLPLTVPLPLNAPAISYPVRVTRRGPYYIAIRASRALLNESERKHKHAELVCKLGIPPSYGCCDCKDVPAAINFQWRLREGQKTIRDGSYLNSDLAGGYSGDSIDGQFASLSLPPGEYELQLTHLTIDPSLALNKPALVLQLDNLEYEGDAWSFLMQLAIGVVCIFVGMIPLGIASRISRDNN